MPENKLCTMNEAVDRFVSNGATVAIEGFTAFICFAAAHEIIRQEKRDLTLCRLTPDLIYDQMVAAGVAEKLVFSYLGNPGVGSLHCIRRAVEKAIPKTLEIEEYSHFGMVGRYIAGASKLPFFPLRSYFGSDLAQSNDSIQFVDSPYGDERISVVPPLNPDVAFIHAQRADVKGNTHIWGLIGVQKEAAFASKKVIVVVEEIVDGSVIRRDPNRTLIPGLIVDAVVHEPYGAHPSYVQGYYDRDNAFYLEWDRISRDRELTENWLKEWVHDVPDRKTYLEKLGSERLKNLKPGEMMAGPVDYGLYD
ncbi:MAG TPA: CoA-transferase [candidate division Zixibacteria bacterium]|nr:CoA-transferase [candidate division Zixibacteria bacterium]